MTVRVVEKNETPHPNTNMVYQYFNITFDKLKPSEVGSATIAFSVNASWFSSNALDEDTAALERYDGGWQRLGTVLVQQGEERLNFSAQSPGFSLFAITAGKAKAREENLSSMPGPKENETRGNATATAQKTGQVGQEPTGRQRGSGAWLWWLAGGLAAILVSLFYHHRKRSGKNRR